MIEVKIFRNPEGSIVGFDVLGHAGKDEVGKDIVCAGVSSLAQTAVLGLQKHLKRQVKGCGKSGKLTARLQGKADDLTDAILETMLLGLQEIEILHKKNVRIIQK